MDEHKEYYHFQRENLKACNTELESTEFFAHFLIKKIKIYPNRTNKKGTLIFSINFTIPI